MLTNLAYAGGGTTGYGDNRSITLSSSGTSYTAARYYNPTGSSPTTNPTNPSTSVNGTGQYGYLYNFCAANGGQTGNGACSSSSSTPVNQSISICPSGWRLPTGYEGEMELLNDVINGGAENTDAGLRSGWLAQRSGHWQGSFVGLGTTGNYWASTQYTNTEADILSFSNSSSNPYSDQTKNYGLAVRCVAD